MSESSENIDEGDHEKVKDLRTPFQLYLNYKMKGCDLNESDRVALQTKYTKRYERMDKRRKYQWIKQAYQSELKAICRYQRRNEVEMKVACKQIKSMIPRSEIVIREEIERKPAKPRHTPSLLYYHMKYPERNAQALKNARLSWKELSVKRKRKYQSLFSKECTHYGRKVIKYLKNYDQKWWHAIVTKEQLPIQIPDVF